MNKIYILTLYAIVFLIQFIFFKDIVFSENLLSSLISVLAIFFGFYVISLSIFSMSKFVGSLYETEVKDKNGYNTTILHILLGYYKFGLLLNLISILYFIFLLFLKGYSVNIGVYFYLALPLIVHNFIYSYMSLDKLIKIIIQELKNNAHK
jgi:hypothetical protein